MSTTPLQEDRQIERRVLKSLNICESCVRRDARPGRLLCQECADKRSRQQKERKRAFREAGICTDCGKRKALKGVQTCGRCKKLSAARSQRAYIKKKEQCVCYCGGEIEAHRAGSRTCENCFQKRRDMHRAKKEKHHSHGTCTRCGKPITGERKEKGRKSCQACADQCRNLAMKWRAKPGACNLCGQKRDRESTEGGFKHCSKCRARGRKYLQKLRKEGRCTRCRKPLDHPDNKQSKVCQACYEYNRQRNYKRRKGYEANSRG